MLFNRLLKKNIIIGVLFFMTCYNGNAKAYFKMTANCQTAQSLIYELRLAEASLILDKEFENEPENMAVLWLEEYSIFIALFISENAKDYDAIEDAWIAIIKKAETFKTNDPWQGFILSEMYLHRAAVKLKLNDNISAGYDIKKANQLLKENERHYPLFLPDNKNIGLINVLFSAVPSNYKWLSNILGFEGNLEEGMTKITTFLYAAPADEENKWLKTETAFIYALLQYHFRKDAAAAWRIIDNQTTDYLNSPVLAYMRATIAGYNGMNDEVIRILAHRHVKSNVQPFYYLDYMLGVAKLRRLDADADQYLKIFTVKFKGENYIKSAYRYLAWNSMIKGDEATAFTYYSLCTKNGMAFQEEDKQAEKEARELLYWKKELLEARLLFDGHYYMHSLQTLNEIDESKLTFKKFLLELNYRKARIFMEKKEYASALLLFDKVIHTGKDESYYYAAYSSLYMANIYEVLKNTSQAKVYYIKAKDGFPNNREYRNSIEQKAKIGLNRLKN